MGRTGTETPALRGFVSPPRRARPLLGGVLLLLPLLLPTRAPGAAAANLLSAPTERKIHASLLRRLTPSNSTAPVDVIVLAHPGREAAVARALRGAQGGREPRRALRLLAGFAARVRADQLAPLARLPAVRRIESDAEVSICMDGAAPAFGVPAARERFGVTGDGDGDPGTFSTRDAGIAVIDTGIDATHVDLAGGKVVGWHDLVNGRPAPYDDHFLGHGTHVAGIAGGSGKGKAGLQGVAPGAALVGVKVLNWLGQGKVADVVAAIEWCVENRERLGIRVLSLSIGLNEPSDGSDAQCLAVDAAEAAGLVVCVAAGNRGPSSPTNEGRPELRVGSPAAARGAITVGAVSDPGSIWSFEDGGPPVGHRRIYGGIYLAPFSSRGPTVDGRVKPDLCAPGVAITAARANTRDHRQYIAYSGTSMAAPFVAGTAALMLARRPDLTPTEVRALLAATAVDCGLTGPDSEWGAGLLDAGAAVAAAAGDAGGTAAVQQHRRIEGRVAAGGTQTFRMEVASAAPPVALTALPLLADPAAPPPNLDLLVRSASGVTLAAQGTGRQETLTFQPAAPGTYDLVISSDSQAEFVVDAAGGFAVENRPPGVAVVGPTDLASAGPSLLLGVAAADSHGVEAVEAALPGGDLIAFRQLPGTLFWEAHLDLSPLAEGAHSLRVRGSDGEGGIGETTAILTVDRTPPGVALLAPTEGADVSGELPVRARCAANDLGVVRARLGGGPWHELTADAQGWTGLLDTRLSPDGPGQLQVEAQDRAGNRAMDAAGVRTFNPPTAPDNLQATPGAETVSLTWEAAVDPDVTGYRLLRAGPGGAYAPVGTTSATTWLQQSLTPGTVYRYRVTALDLAGLESPPAEVTGVPLGRMELALGVQPDSAHRDQVRIRVTATGAGRPLPGVAVTVRLVSSPGRERRWRGATRADGTFTCAFRLWRARVEGEDCEVVAEGTRPGFAACSTTARFLSP